MQRLAGLPTSGHAHDDAVGYEMAGGNGQIVAAVAAVEMAPGAEVEKLHATKGLPPGLGVAGVTGVEGAAGGGSGVGPAAGVWVA
jgi:hypothetical protein